MAPFLELPPASLPPSRLSPHVRPRKSSHIAPFGVRGELAVVLRRHGYCPRPEPCGSDTSISPGADAAVPPQSMDVGIAAQALHELCCADSMSPANFYTDMKHQCPVHSNSGTIGGTDPQSRAIRRACDGYEDAENCCEATTSNDSDSCTSEQESAPAAPRRCWQHAYRSCSSCQHHRGAAVVGRVFCREVEGGGHRRSCQ